MQVMVLCVTVSLKFIPTKGPRSMTLSDTGVTRQPQDLRTDTPESRVCNSNECSTYPRLQRSTELCLYLQVTPSVSNGVNGQSLAASACRCALESGVGGFNRGIANTLIIMDGRKLLLDGNQATYIGPTIVTCHTLYEQSMYSRTYNNSSGQGHRPTYLNIIWVAMTARASLLE
jgi:hypothetical protein